MEYRDCQIENRGDANGDHYQHSFKMRCASITSLEVMEVKRLRRASAMLLLVGQNLADDSSSSEDGESAVQLSCMMNARVKKLVGVKKHHLCNKKKL